MHLKAGHQPPLSHHFKTSHVCWSKSTCLPTQLSPIQNTRNIWPGSVNWDQVSKKDASIKPRSLAVRPATMDDLGVADNGRCAKILGRHTKGNYGKPSNFGAGKPIHDQSRTAHTAKATAFLKVPRNTHRWVGIRINVSYSGENHDQLHCEKEQLHFFMRGWPWFFAAMIMKHQTSRGILSRLCKKKWNHHRNLRPKIHSGVATRRCSWVFHSTSFASCPNEHGLYIFIYIYIYIYILYIYLYIFIFIYIYIYERGHLSWSFNVLWLNQKKCISQYMRVSTGRWYVDTPLYMKVGFLLASRASSLQHFHKSQPSSAMASSSKWQESEQWLTMANHGQPWPTNRFRNIVEVEVHEKITKSCGAPPQWTITVSSLWVLARIFFCLIT